MGLLMRVGILGGSFNPVHHGHLRMALEAREILGLDRVELVPAAVPPHKNRKGLLPFGLRCALLRAAVEQVDGLSVNLLEGRRKGPSYTWDTLTDLRGQQPGAEFFFLLGVPDFLMLPQWRQGLDLPLQTNLVAVARQGQALDEVRAFVRRHWSRAQGPDRQVPGREGSGRGDILRWSVPESRSIVFIQPPGLEISATMIRAYWRGGRELYGLVPQAVRAWMRCKDHLLRRYWTDMGEC
jgi:nicotinate-nucleotide adenylyltransferase